MSGNKVGNTLPGCICVNGAERHLDVPARLAQLPELASSAQRDGIAVAVNGEVVPRAMWAQKEVHDGDDIEIVRAVQGG
jgi:sulfur carrier protein